MAEHPVGYGGHIIRSLGTWHEVVHIDPTAG
jgi:hypothetical protein